MVFEEEIFLCEVSLLGNLGSCFHYKNGHTKKDFSALKNNKNSKFDTNLHKRDKGKSSSTKDGLADNGPDFELGATRSVDPIIGTMDNNKFVSMCNPLFEEDFYVVPTLGKWVFKSSSDCQVTHNSKNNNDELPLSPQKLNA